jgi:hypothetical protein
MKNVSVRITLLLAAALALGASQVSLAMDLAACVASPLSSATTGAALPVDGGVVKSAF